MPKHLDRHQFKPLKEPINPIYVEVIDKPGYSFFGIIGMKTKYKMVLNSCDGYKDSDICVCKKHKTHKIHNYKLLETEF